LKTTQIAIGTWVFSHADENPRIGVVHREQIRGLKVQIVFDVDCAVPLVTIGDVKLLNADSLQVVSSGITRSYGNLGPFDAKSNETHITDAVVEIFGVTTHVALEQGVYWAVDTPRRNEWGVPRIGFRARALVRYKSKTSYYTRKRSAGGGSWGPVSSDPVRVSQPTSHVQLSDWSDVASRGATYDCGTQIQMPSGAGRAWTWATPQEYAASAPPADPQK
jgi:hypothetical protein